MVSKHISVSKIKALIGMNRGFSFDVDSREANGIGFKPVSHGLVCKVFQYTIDKTDIQGTVV